MFWRKRQKATDRVSDPAEFTSGALTVADVFSITGRGTVVTGLIDHGRLAKGQTVTVTRNGQVVVAARIDGVEQFRKVVTAAGAGENVGLLLRGVDKSQVQPGDVITG